MGDPTLRRTLIDFEIAIDVGTADEVGVEDWGRAFLAPSLPLVWHSSKIVLERPDGGLPAVEALADAALADFAHRTAVILDEAAGAQLADEAEITPGWEAERIRYMVWRGEPAGSETTGAASADAARGVREVRLADLEPLRRQLTMESMPAGELDPAETADQLLELDRRIGTLGGDRWYVAPADDPASACRLLRDADGIGQVEDVATLEAARGHGLATAIVDAARLASQQAGDKTTFITADAADWPQFFYERLGFVPVGDLHVLRRRPTA